jgi:hypothetical protein
MVRAVNRRRLQFKDKRSIETEEAYKQRLASFLLRFNSIEVCMADIIKLVFSAKGLPAMGERLARDENVKQIEYFKALQADDSRFENFPRGAIEKLSSKRNALAHGSLRFSYIDGTYSTVGRKGTKTITPEDIAGYTDEADELLLKVQDIQMELWLEDLELESLGDGERPTKSDADP